MFNTMTITKIGGALCGALLVFLLLNWVAGVIYFAPAGHGENAEAAYLLETDEEEPAETAEAPAEETADAGSDGSTDAGTDAATDATAGTDAATDAAASSEGSTDTGADTSAGSDGATMVAAGDPEKGEKVFKKCKACHDIEAGANKTGPTLYQIVGRPVASIADFSYSSGMSNLGGTWTPEHLDAFLAKPKDLVPDTKMSFAGLRKEDDRADLIAYLETLGN